MKKILEFFGYIPSKEVTEELNGFKKDIELLQNDVKSRDDEILKLKAENISLKKEEIKRPHIPIDLGDPSPEDGEKRQQYVANVAGFHKDVLAPKIKQIIAGLRESFEQVNRETFGLTQTEYDRYIKATINGMWLLYDWGESMINEQLANQQSITEEETDELKAKLD